MTVGVRIVLVETKHPGNIGSVARAMKNMGLKELVLVKPRCFTDDPEAQALAVNAADILNDARIVSSFAEAVADCGVVFGTAADNRDQVWPTLSAEKMAKKIHSDYASEKVAVVFGRESTGLNNEELTHCQAQIQIPTADEYTSLNLAQAVQVVCYEIFKAQHTAPEKQLPALADQQKCQILYEAFTRAAETVGYFDPARPLNFPVRMQQIIQQMALLDKDADLLLGFLKRVR